MECAIPEHLESLRTRHRRVPDDMRRPTVLRGALQAKSDAGSDGLFRPAISRHAGGNRRTSAGVDHCAFCAGWRALALGPRAYVDGAGFKNVVSVAYWDDRAKFDGWFAAARDGWTGTQPPPTDRHVVEVLCPWVEGYETLFSSLEGPRASRSSPAA